MAPAVLNMAPADAEMTAAVLAYGTAVMANARASLSNDKTTAAFDKLPVANATTVYRLTGFAQIFLTTHQSPLTIHQSPGGEPLCLRAYFQAGQIFSIDALSMKCLNHRWRRFHRLKLKGV